MQKEVRVEFVKGLLSNADTLINSVFILNGAAAAGLLTFLGNTVEKKTSFSNWSLFGNAIIAFALGLILVLLANFLKMLTLNFAAQIRSYETLRTNHDIAINISVENKSVIYALITATCFTGSSICFIAGVLIGKYAIFG
jgi:hypothetical protein